MDGNLFIRFCKEINFNIPDYLKESNLREVTQKYETKQFSFCVDFFCLPNYDDLNIFFKKTCDFFKPWNVEWNIRIMNKNLSEKGIYEIVSFYFNHFLNENLSDLFNTNNLILNLNENVLNISVHSKLKLNLINEKLPSLKKSVAFFNLDNLQIKIKDFTQEILISEENNFWNTQKIEIQKIQQKRKEFSNKNEIQIKNNYNNKKNKIKYFKISMEEFYYTEEQNLLIEGTIFQIDSLITKSELEIKTIYVTDYNEAVIAKIFIRKENNFNLSWLDKNKMAVIYGEKKVDYNGFLYIHIKNIEEIKNNDEELDKEENKRIELSARTSMSPMDGFISPTNLLKHAKKMNHKAVAIVDFQNIQAFPEIYNNAKKIGIKPIYGATFSTTEYKNNIVFNMKNINIKEETYIVFDLETTSLNPRFGEIIEFGAIKVKKGNVIEKYQFFIKPSSPISSFTTQLTGITQDMIVQKAKLNELEGIKRIIEIFKDYTLVAHNAHFDISFINEKLFQYNLDPLNNQVIDTLSLSKFIIEIANNYRLETISKKFGIMYDPSVAHRADYDANVLQKIWNLFIDWLYKRDIFTFEQLDKIDVPHIHNKKFTHDLIIYAKNQKGLKELFKLISLSLTKNFYNGPKLFLEKLEKSKNLLFAPASINSKLIDLMFTGTTKEIDEELNKWDFIGIPSPHLFSHLVARENCTEEELKIMLKDLILKAKKKNKIVVAIGDVRYLDDRDIIGHSVYINTKGLEGRRHNLYKYNEISPKYPIQKYLNTTEMKKQFSFLNSSNLIDEIVVKNTNLINEMIDDDIEIIKSKLYSPEFDDSATKLKELVYKNAHLKYGENLPKIVEERIKRELTPIIKYGFSVVYWISYKLVSKSNNDGYLVGSRGSVGSSLVATLSGITEVNPLIPHYICSNCKLSEFIYNAKTTSGFDLPDKICPKCNMLLTKEGQTIPFETFLGFNADKIPDIDLNFSGEYQSIIHKEVKQMFGETHTFRAGTIATVASKTAFGFCKKWNEEKNMNKSNTFIHYLSTIIEGSKRTTGQHPGGIIIIPKEFDVEDFTPVNYPANDIKSEWQTTHFDFHAIHDNVLKLDLLGHDDPTTIKLLQKLTNVDLKEISFSDKNVISLFTSTKILNVEPKDINDEPTGVLGIPEFGTRFVRKMLNVAKPKTFNDLINLSGLSHGTDVWNGNAENLIKSGHTLNEVISCRDDIMVYLMKKGLEPSLSFNIMEKVRKGKGLTKEEEETLLSTGIEKWYIDSLNKIKYMFPKAHATAYVMMAWRIAWFKIYYPLQYYAAYFTIRVSVFDIDIALSSKDNIQKKLKELEIKQKNKNENKISAKEEELIPILEIINEMLARKIKIGNIDLYKSYASEWLIDEKNNLLIPPFIAIDGLGEVAAKTIVNARKERKFSSIEDLIKRTQLNKTVIEKLKTLKVITFLDETDQLKLW